MTRTDLKPAKALWSSSGENAPDNLQRLPLNRLKILVCHNQRNTHEKIAFTSPTRTPKTPAMDMDFRSVLLRELSIRQSKNPRYSLRGFAKALNLSPSSLSALLRSKRRPSPALIQRLGPDLGLSESEIASFAKTSGEVIFQNIPDEVYEKIADWYHYPILELTKVKGFQPSAGYVALRLGITLQEAQEAVDRLVQVGLLEVTEKRWKDISLLGNATSVNTRTTSASKRKLQRQLLHKGIDSLESVPFELRINNSSTVAINKKDLPVARERIIKFYRKLLADLEETRTPSDVYNLSIAFFPLTKEIES